MAERFVSYAQNFEDVMLWRALKHVDHGFYIDIGAGSPDELSVTKAFYDRGWRGINVEPQPDYQRRLVADRPRDINLAIALGDRAGEVAMYFVGNTGLSTIDAGEARKRTDEGFDVVEGVVMVETLASIWVRHVAADQPVHFLKVDVEGAEPAVLLGGDWVRCRPWIVVVEATQPLSQQPSYDAWEGVLTGSGYGHVYGDGLNRFYVADEHAELRGAFTYPPNVFDDFVRAPELHGQAALVTAEAATARAARAEGELAAMRATRSWQLTRPLRSAARWARKVKRDEVR